MSNVRSGLLFSFFGKYGLKLINLVSTVLVARLLTPAEIGTFAIASSVVMILTEVKLLGANAYLVREHVLDDNKIRKAYGMTILMCWGIAFTLILGSSALANFFNHADLQMAFVILALGFFLAPYVSVPDSLLVREYRFKEITIVRISSTCMQVIGSLLLIYAGAGFYALAWGYFINMVVQATLYLYFTRDVRIYRPNFRGISEIAKLGIFTSVSNIVRRIHYTASDIVIGKMGSPTEVGIFSRGMGFIDFISQSVLDGIGSVSQPYMSDMQRRGNDVSIVFTKITALLCSLVWPILAIAGFAALPAIRLLFGDQWDSSAPIATVLAIWMILKVCCFFSTPLLIAVGQEVLMFKRDVALFLLLVMSLIYSYPYGLTFMSYAFLLNAGVEVVLTLWMLKSSVQLNVKNYLSALVKPLIVTINCFAVAYLIDHLWPFSDSEPLKVFGILAFSMPVIWLLSTKVLKLQIYDEFIALLIPLFHKVTGRF